MHPISIVITPFNWKLSELLTASLQELPPNKQTDSWLSCSNNYPRHQHESLFSRQSVLVTHLQSFHGTYILSTGISKLMTFRKETWHRQYFINYMRDVKFVKFNFERTQAFVFCCSAKHTAESPSFLLSYICVRLTFDGRSNKFNKGSTW